VLGVRLLNRTTRRVSLTEIGRGYYERCVQLLLGYRCAEDSQLPLARLRKGVMDALTVSEMGNNALCPPNVG
jgi:DNA-binding transcriptional LysR family regulator